MGQYDAPQGPPPNYNAHPNGGQGEASAYYSNTPVQPQNAYYPPQQGYASPAPMGQGPYMPPQQGYGPPMGQQQPMYYQQQGYPPPQGYYAQDTRGHGSTGGGICAGVLSALACCCCLDILF